MILGLILKMYFEIVLWEEEEKMRWWNCASITCPRKEVLWRAARGRSLCLGMSVSFWNIQNRFSSILIEIGEHRFRLLQNDCLIPKQRDRPRAALHRTSFRGQVMEAQFHHLIFSSSSHSTISFFPSWKYYILFKICLVPNRLICLIHRAANLVLNQVMCLLYCR